METEVRFRLAALEEKVRENQALTIALRSILLAHPEFFSINRERAHKEVRKFTHELPDGPALQLKASAIIDQLCTEL